MKKIIVFLYLFICLFGLQSYAQSKWSIKGGLTISYFTNIDKSEPGLGFTVGIARDFNLKENFSIIGEIDFALRNATLNDRTIVPYEQYNKINSYYWDIKLRMGFIDMPILFQYLFHLNDKTNLIFFAGPSFSIPILDLSKIEKKGFFEEYDPDNSSEERYNFWFGDGEEHSAFWSNDTKIIYNFGCKIVYLSYFIEFKYILDTRNVYYIDNISRVNHGMNSIYILIGKML